MKAVIDYYENMTEEQELEEIEAYEAELAARNVTLIEVPNELVDEVWALIARKRVA